MHYAFGRNLDGRLEVFVLRQNGTCLHYWQKEANGDFSGGRELGAVGWQQIAMGRNADGRLQVFALSTGDVWHFWQTAPDGGWSHSKPLGATGVTQVAVERNADGRLEVFALRGNGRCLHFYQVSANGDFTGGKDIGAVDWKQMAMGRNADGRLELFALVNGDVYHLRQTAPNAGWSSSATFPYPEPDFTPTDLTLTQTPLNDDESRIDWSVGTGPCCTVDLRGDSVGPTGSKRVWRPRNTQGLGTEYRLTATCGKNQKSKVVTVPVSPAGTPPPPLFLFCFKVVNPTSGICSTFQYPAKSKADAEAAIRSENPSGVITVIECSQMSTACPK